ncbi:MAG TPA: hypothetical protein VGE47_02220 [Burkholderiaceae bacterium]
MARFISPRPMTVKLRGQKPRNPFVAPALQRQAGSHGSGKERQQAQRRLQQELRVLGPPPDRSP